MFDNVNIDWHLSHDEGSTDFSDDEMLDDHPRLNGSRTPDHLSPEKDQHHTPGGGRRPLSVFTPVRGSRSEWGDDGDSPHSYHRSNSNMANMPPPPPPQGKKPSICKLNVKFCFDGNLCVKFVFVLFSL